MTCDKEGVARFCRGCESAGAFLGPITEDKPWNVEEFRETRLMLSITDRDGAQSSPSIVLAESDATLRRMNEVTGSEWSSQRREFGRMLVRRIATCEAGELARVKCPAIGDSALSSILKRG